MRIVSLELERRTTELGALRREGLFVRMIDETGRSGLGEASPLPGYSPDDLASCEHELERLVVPPVGPDPMEVLSLSRELIPEGRPPAARAALEMALLDLAGQRTSEPVWALLRRAGDFAASSMPSLLPLAALLDAKSESELVMQAKAALARGIRTLKVKIGRHGPFELELERLRALRREIGPSIRLRLDANRSFLPTQARERLELLAELDPEYVEEPVRDSSKLENCPVPIALDETLHDAAQVQKIEHDARFGAVVALVLKPGALGIARSLELARLGRAHGLDLVLSHQFEGPVAFAAAAHLALAVGSSERAAGLDRHGGLALHPELEVPLVSPAHVVSSSAPGLGLAPAKVRAA